jgi:AcrR family transcriptional regulator
MASWRTNVAIVNIMPRIIACVNRKCCLWQHRCVTLGVMDAKPDTYHHGNLKSALLKAAFKLIEKAGGERFTLREVARKARVSHNAPYRHFPSKESLLATLATESLRQLHQALRATVDECSEPDTRLHVAALAYLRFALKNPSRFNVMFHSTFDRNAYPDYVAAYTGLLGLLAELIQQHRDFATPTETAGELVWASIHGIAELGLAGRLRHGSQPELEQLANAATSALLAGLR